MTERRWIDLATGKTYSYSWAIDESEDTTEILLRSRGVKSLANLYKYTNNGGIKHTVTEPDRYVPEIKKVIYNDPATIVYWADGTKTVVKVQEDDVFDAQTGLLMAIAKKALAGNRGRYCNELEKFGAHCKKDLVEESPFDRLIRHVREDIAEAGALIINKITHKTETEDGVEIKIELTGKK
jgi:hypothetical protein